MSLFNSSSSVVHYMALGEIPYDLGTYVFLLGGTAGAVGRLAALYIVSKYGRPSVFIFSLVGVMTISLGVYLAYLFTSEVDFETTGASCI